MADVFFYDRAAQAWIGANTWWAVDLIHTSGGAMIRLIGLAALGGLITSFRVPRLRPFRRHFTFLVLALVLCPVVVAGLKQVTNVDCPRALTGFGGTRLYVALLGDRPDELLRAYCYPGSHASSGFALMAFYFVLADTRPRLARRLLAAAIAWFLLLALWCLLLKSPATGPSRLIVPVASVQPQDGVSPRGSAVH